MSVQTGPQRVGPAARRKHVILFLAANPSDSARLTLPEECAEIQRELKMAPNRDDFHFESKWAIGIDELMQHLTEFDPTIIHFSGHGGGSEGLMLQDAHGRPQLISAKALARIVDVTARSVRVIILNACYTATQATALRRRIDCTVGVEGAIGDDAARAFAIRFYSALGNRRSIGNAVDQGNAALEAKQISHTTWPRCLTRRGIDAHQLFLTPHPPPSHQLTNVPHPPEANGSVRQDSPTGPSVRDIEARVERTPVDRLQPLPEHSTPVRPPRRASRRSLVPTLCLAIAGILVAAIWMRDRTERTPVVRSDEVALTPPYGIELVWERVQGISPTPGRSISPRESDARDPAYGALYVSRNEITVAQYEACVRQLECPVPSPLDDACNWGNPERRQHPINCVNWFDAVKYTKWASRWQRKAIRLPTAVELEYLESHDGRMSYPWGNEAPTCDRATLAFEAACAPQSTSMVCSHRVPVDAPICDLIGNVWEWSSDSRIGNASTDAPKILGGGSWRQGPAEIGKKATDWRDPFTRNSAIGFRVVYSD